MAKPSKAIMEFMEKYGVDSDEIWLAPGGKSWVVMHKALERIATEQGVVFERPSVIACDVAAKSMVVCTFAKLGERTEWSFGEASPANNKNAYMAAMAEKRSRDRVILKLLSAHGTLYSEAEADEFEQKRQNPHVTRPQDVFDPVEYDQHGQPVDNIPQPDAADVKKLRVVDQRPIFEALQKEIHATGSITALRTLGESKSFSERFACLKSDWQEFLRGVYAEHQQALRLQEQGDDLRMAG